MKTIAYALLVMPVALAGIRLYSGKYIYSALTTLSCAIIALISGAPGWMWAASGFILSIAGDFFMNRKDGFLFGIAGFFCAHVCFMAYALFHFGEFSIYSASVGALIIIGYAVFLALRVYPREARLPIKIALSMYMLISVAVFTLSLCARPFGYAQIAFSAGIFMIMFSDTLIGLGIYAKTKWSGKWVLPTYYLCHVLIALSLVIQIP